MIVYSLVPIVFYSQSVPLVKAFGLPERLSFLYILNHDVFKPFLTVESAMQKINIQELIYQYYSHIKLNAI